MLQIRVHHYHIVGVGVLQSRVHRRLLAEVAGEGDIFDIVELRSKALHNQIGLVLAAVVDEYVKEAVIGDRGNDLVGFPDEMLQTCFLIIARYDQIN